MSEKYINTWDVIKGVGEVVVDEARLVLRAVFRMPHELSSHGEHFTGELERPNPIHLNRYEDEL